MDDDTIFGGLFNLGDTNGALIAVRLVESSQLLKGVFAGDVGVEDKEGGVVFAEDVGGQLQGASSAEGLCLDGEGDLDTEFFLVLDCNSRIFLSATTNVGMTQGRVCIPLSGESP